MEPEGTREPEDCSAWELKKGRTGRLGIRELFETASCCCYGLTKQIKQGFPLGMGL